MERFEGRVTLITGGASGIGRASAMRIALERGAVAIADIDDETGLETCQAIEDVGGQAILLHADVTQAVGRNLSATSAVALHACRPRARP